MKMAVVPMEIHSFMLKFNHLSNAGFNASLNLNCVNGRVYANLVADLGTYQNFHDNLPNSQMYQPHSRRSRRRWKCKKSEETRNMYDESKVCDISKVRSDQTVEDASLYLPRQQGGFLFATSCG